MRRRLLDDLWKMLKARALSERSAQSNMLAAPPRRDPTFTYDPMLAFYAVLEEERTDRTIRTPHEIAEMDLAWREDVATVREMLRFARDLPKYPADMQA